MDPVPVEARRRARVVKGFGIGTLVASMVLLAPLIFAASRMWGPQCTTMYLHYNLQYRAGKIDVENTILNESLRAMVTMMDRHPNWHYSIECQAYAIERLLREPEHFPGILEMLQRQNQRGQLEILCGVYSSQIVAAFPRYALDLSYNITADILQEAGLKQSRALVHQEGQVTEGLAYALGNNPRTNIDTIIVSKQQIDDFWPGQKPTWEQPIQRVTLGGKTMNLLVYDYLPRYEAGYWHGWTWTLDAELAIEKQHGEDHEFQVDPARVLDWERHWENLERHGNTFMTIEEWVDHCEQNGYVEDLPHYQPTTHWGPTKYDTCFIWYGNGNGNVDDGAMHAMNYRTQGILRATTWLNRTYGHLMNSSAAREVNYCFANASRSMLLAMVTDTTGITPNPTERQYGYDHASYAVSNCSRIVELIQWAVDHDGSNPELASASRIQVDLSGGTNATDPAKFHGYEASKGVTGAELNSSFPLTVRNELAGTTNLTRVDLTEGKLYGVDAYRYAVIFPGTNVWSADGVSCSVWFEGERGKSETNEIVYPVDLAEYLPMVRITRTDYTPDSVLKFHLPISSGLLFVPSEPGSSTGAAIIWNCSSYQVAPRWTPDALRFMVTDIHLDATFEFYLLDSVEASAAQDLANQLNTNGSFTISADFNLMEGHEYFDAYANSVKGDQWSGTEWWG
ncbi:MAG: hypothetical protein ACTSU5_00825 [Promethearchaeota archaeon]